MCKCEICQKEFNNNLGGQLTTHLKNKHNLSLEDYYVMIELKGIEPKCECSYCNERPNFHRGKFSKYAIGHNKYKWIEKQYIEKYGNPTCQNSKCNKIVRFNRGIPNKYCSHSCQNNNWNQNKVKQTVNETYGVDNIFQSEIIKEKSKETLLKKYGVEHYSKTLEFKKRNKITNNKIYGVDNVFQSEIIKEKSKETLLKKYGVEHYSKTLEFKEMASKNMCKYNENVITNHKIKYYKNTDLYYQSQHEFRFLEYCDNNNLLNYVNNSPTFKYINKDYGKWHLPDYQFKNKFIIEIKSTYWMERQGGINKINEKKKSVEYMGFKYIFILNENYEDFLKII